MPNKRKLVKDATQESPYSKRSRRTKPNQSDIAEKILETIKSHQKEDGSCIASSFLKVPSKRHNPEYHEIVQEPIDLSRITQRLKMDEYRDIESLTADIDLLVSNAKKFYEDDSPEYQEANALWELYLDTKTLVMAGEVSEEPVNGDVISKIDDIYNFLLAEVDEEGQGLTDYFMVLPDDKAYPDYYLKIKDPIDFTTIGERIENREYKTVADFERDIKQLIKNARSYNEPNSKIYNNAVALKNALQDKLQSDSVEKTEKLETGVKTSARLKQRLSAKLDGDGVLRRQDAVDVPESGVRSSRATILLQASITDTNLKEREALQARFYNEIVNFRNPLGHSISDAFVRLPNKHHYPAYYEEIENPISLKTIRRNILSGRHKTFEDLADDFRLLFENAKQYNKEGSQIYKNAKTLSDVMEQNLARYTKLEEELEESDEEKEEEGDESEDEDGDEVDYEQDDESTPDGKKSRRRKDSVKSKGSGQKDKPQNRYRKQLRTLYDAVLEGTFEDRNMIGLFMEKPSRKDYPDYYKLILEPIDMKMIDKKIRQDKYPTVFSLIEDFQLMFTNARHYNEPGSQVYQDADRLQEILTKKQQELPSLLISDSSQSLSGTDSFIQKMNSLTKSMEHIHHSLRDYRDPMGREICEIFNKLPSKLELPDYYQVIKKPMDNDRILQKIQANSYLNLNEFMADVLLMFENACLYNEPGSLIYKDALVLQKVAVDVYDEMAGDHKSSSVPYHVQELLTNLFVSVINHQDEDGRCYSDSLLTPLTTADDQEPPTDNTTPAPETMDTSESTATMEPQSQEQAPVPQVDDKKVTLEIIRRNLHAQRYRRLDVFQDHMFQVFESTRKSNRTDCEVYEDAVELQRFFIRIRDELCKNGEILMSPALAYTAKRMQNDLDAEKQEKLPGEALEYEAGKDEGKEMRENIQKLSSTDGMDVQGVTYQPGDFVYVENTAEANKPPHIVCIEKLYHEETGEQKMYGVWFFRPQDTYHLQTRRFLIKEVFKSDYYNAVPVTQIKGKCFVMLVKDYFKQKPVGYLEDDVYVCVSRYSSMMKSFKRIKLLNLPQNNTKIIQRENPLVPIRVSSVYSEDSKSGMEMPKLSDMHGPLVTDNKPWPSDVISKVKQNIKIENNLTTNASQTFYLQFNMNKLCLKVGDCVYVTQNSDDQRLKIARIESMWSDVNGEMWFQGSWFAQPCDTEHEPTRMFYKNEVFLLSFNSPNSDEATASVPPPTPLSWVVGICAVLSVREITQCRPTEVPETHIHVCESRYLAADKVIKKIKGFMKKLTVSHQVVEDEYYYFKSPLEVIRELSPHLLTSVRDELAEREDEFANEQEENRRKALQVQQQPQGLVPGAQYAVQINPMMQPGPQRQYPVQQYQPYQQHHYQQQPYITHPPQQQQYVVQTNQPQGVPMQPTYQQPQYQPGTSYAPHPILHHPQSGTQLQAQPQLQYHQGMQPTHPYTPGQPGITHIPQLPIQSGVQQASTPIDRVETPGSSGSVTPTTTTKKKNRGGHSTGYILFASQCHPRMRAEHPTMPFGDISKLVGEEWRNQSDEKKREYEEKARELTAKAEAEGRPMQGKKKKKQQMRREMEEAAAAAQQQQQQQHPPPQPHVMMQQPVIGQPYTQTQYHTGQYPASQAGYQPGMPATPQHGTPQQQYPGQTPQMVTTPAGQPQPAYATPGPIYATPTNAPAADQPVYINQPTSMRRGPLFVKPPPIVQRVLHSEAYLRYIDSLEKGNRTISNFEKTLSVEEKDVELSQADIAKLPSHWLANGKGRHETIKSALWSLRDLMLKDALAIKNHFV